MNIDLLLNSGAFSAHSRGVKICLRDFIGFVQDFQIKNYIGLDHIGGANGVRVHDPRAAEQTYANHQETLAAGLLPIPVFHRQDHPKWLERYVKDGESRIALAPHPANEQPQIINWLTFCFKIIPPTVQVHGLGLTAAMMLQTFPFTSADSISWAAAEACGNVLVPRFDSKGPDFRHSPHTISVSGRSPHSKQFGHLDFLLQQQAEAFFTECGTSLDELRVSRMARQRVNLKYYLGLAAASNVKIYFVSCVHDRTFFDALHNSGVRSHLLSYAELKDNIPGMVKYLWRTW